MSDWVCTNCGTMNKDIFDVGINNPSVLAQEFYGELYKRRHELEMKGERWKYKCERCEEDRL